LSGSPDALHVVLPTFAVIGAMKAGTTSVCSALSAHPDVFVCTPKEPQFFTTQWHKGMRWYESLFAAAGPAIARGEGSTSYTDFPRKPEAAARMAATQPHMRIVYVVRDPISRMRSHYRHRVADGEETRPIEIALLDDRYLLRSCYGLQLEQYLQHFPREQILVVDGADLLGGGSGWQRLFSFLGVPNPASPVVLPRANDGDRRMQLRPSTRALRQRMSRHPVYARTPASLRAVARRLGTRPATPNDEAVISPELRTSLHALLAADMQRFAVLAGWELSLQ
jgi:hypothetical protein